MIDQQESPKLIPAHGGYRELQSYQMKDSAQRMVVFVQRSGRMGEPYFWFLIEFGNILDQIKNQELPDRAWWPQVFERWEVKNDDLTDNGE